MLPVSLDFAAALALFNLFLAFRISRLRMSGKVLVGTGDHPLIETRMRAHANFVEYAPFALALVALLELAGASRTWLWAAVAAFMLARVAHAFGMDVRRSNPARAGGALVTWVVLLVLAVWAVRIAAMGAGPHETML